MPSMMGLSPNQTLILTFMIFSLVLSLGLILVLRRSLKKDTRLETPPAAQPKIKAQPLEPPRGISGVLAKTRNALSGKIESLFATNAKIDDKFLDQLEELLYTSDLGPATVEKLLNQVRENLPRNEISDLEKIKTAIKNGVIEILNRSNKQTVLHTPQVILIVGVNGVGKTTSIGKLSYYYAQKQKSVMVVAADTFRAAAEKQLGVWAERAGVSYYSSDKTTDPAAVAYQGLEKALSEKTEVVIIDTAGRLHNKENLMEELKKVKRVIQKLSPEAPHQILLVIDANSGQNAIVQARQFNEALGLTGLIVTKLDGSAKGGVIVGISQEVGVNPDFIGLGEKITDLEIFSATEYAQGLLA